LESLKDELSNNESKLNELINVHNVEFQGHLKKLDEGFESCSLRMNTISEDNSKVKVDSKTLLYKYGQKFDADLKYLKENFAKIKKDQDE
jgi:hypothetical protein